MIRISAVCVVLAGLTLAPPSHVRAQDDLQIPPEVMEMIRGDISTIHMDVMQSTILLQPGQSGTFWSLYDEYLQGLGGLTEQRTELIRDFVVSFEGMTDAQADELARRSLEIDQRRTELLSDTFRRISGELGGRVAAQFLQIEYRIATLKDLRIMMELPIISQ